MERDDTTRRRGDDRSRHVGGARAAGPVRAVATARRPGPGSRAGRAVAAATALVLALLGSVVVAAPASAATSGLAVDTRWSGSGSISVVRAIARSADRWLVAGTGGAQVRLDDGTVDPGFSATVTGGAAQIMSAAVHGDGWLIGGQFTAVNGEPVGNFARLNADGSVDRGFTDGLGGAFDAYVWAIVPDGFGGTLVGGQFGASGAVRRHLTRITSAGSIDPTFDADVPSGQHVYAIAPGDDGYLIGTNLQWNQVHPLIKLTDAGVQDPTFTANLGSGMDGYVRDVAWDGTGWVVGGTFTTADGEAAPRLARFDAAGHLDTGFAAALGSGPSGQVLSIVRAGDGWLIGGDFTTVDGRAMSRLARITGTGAPDHAFADALPSGVDGPVYALATDGAGRVALGGAFGAVAGEPRARLAALVPTTVTTAAVADQADRVGDAVDLTVSGSAVTTRWGEIPVRYSATGLPAGLTIDATTGAISGTPTTVGVGTVTVTTTARPLSHSQTFTWTIGSAPSLTGTPPAGEVGAAYSYAVTASGTPAPAVALDEGTLPPGLTLSGSTISGTPTAPGTFPFTLRAGNGFAPDATLEASITITAGAVDLGAATITAAPASIVADGVDTSTVTVTLVDAFGNPVAGADVVLSTTAGSLGGVADAGDGTYTAVLTSGTVTETAEVSFAVDGVEASARVGVVFTAGPVDLDAASISADPTSIVADGESTSTITVTLVDGLGNPVAGADVAASTTAGSLGGVTDAGDGTYTAVLTSGAVAEAATVSFAVAGTVAPASVDVVFTEPPAVPVPAVVLRDASRRVGQEQVVSGSGFVAGERVEVSMASDPVVLGTVQADGAGAFTFAFEVPVVEQGTHTVTAAGARSASATFAVLVASPGGGGDDGDTGAGGGGVLAWTGSSATPLMGAALLLILVGVLAVRRRARSEA